MSAVCFQAEISAPGWSLVQRNPTDCGMNSVSADQLFSGQRDQDFETLQLWVLWQIPDGIGLTWNFRRVSGGGGQIPIKYVLLNKIILATELKRKINITFSKQLLRRWCWWCRATSHGTISTIHTAYAAAIKTTTHPKTRCRKPYAATQHLMLLMMGICSRNMSS